MRTSLSTASRLFVIAALATGACSSNGDSGGGATPGAGGASGAGAGGAGRAGMGGAATTCAPGTTQMCFGPAACQGAQVCAPDGKSWGVCNCGTMSAGGAGGGSGGGGGSAGAATGGSSSGTGGSSPAAGGAGGTSGGAGDSGAGGTSGGGTSVGGTGGFTTPCGTLTTLDLHQATLIDNPPDLADWPVSTNITEVAFQYMGMDGVHVQFSKQNGADRWPDVIPPGFQGALQYTLGLELIS